MTALDDALNSGSIEYGPHVLRAYWREEGNDDILTNPDAIGNLTPQATGVYQIDQSMDDALPDPVTMTTGNQASGSLSAGLNGRDGDVLGSTIGRTLHSSAVVTGVGLIGAQVPYPSNAVVGDIAITAVLVNSPTTMMVQVRPDPKDHWDYLGSVWETTDISMHVYATRVKSNGQPLKVQADGLITFVAMTVCFSALTPSGTPMRFRLLNINSAAESVSSTAHPIEAKLSNKGYLLAFFGCVTADGTMSFTGPSGSAEWGESIAATGLDLMAATSNYKDAGIYTMQANTPVATARLIKFAIGVEPYERPKMDARQYFSPFNKNSPVYGYDRSVADVVALGRVLTTDGPEDTLLFSGQMQDIPLDGRNATLEAVSKARIAMNRSVQLPIVSGQRENMTVDWLATWLMARGGTFVWAAPNQYTRSWWTMYGSLHATFGHQTAYNNEYAFINGVTPAGPYGVKYPKMVTGPKGLPAMFAQQTADRTDEINLNQMGKSYLQSKDEFPHLFEDGGSGSLMIDQFSLQNSKGRVSFWVRGDANASAPAYLTGAGGFDGLFQIQVEVRNAASSYLGYVRLILRADNRQPNVTMGCSSNGFGGVNLSATYAIPTDGNWHFVGFWWDYAAGQYHIKVDGNNLGSISTFFATNGWNFIGDLPVTEEANRRAGGTSNVSIQSHLPISDILVDAGNPVPNPSTGWDDLYPNVGPPGDTATYRPTFQLIEGIAEPTAVNAWDTFAELARNSLAAYRCNEFDAIHFLPLKYFGEPAQMTPAAIVQDTQTNAGDLDVTIDATKMRNVVTLRYLESKIDASPQPVLNDTSGMQIPRGTTYITFPLDIPAVEIHGALTPGSSPYQIVTLYDPASWATPTSPPANRHFLTASKTPDGSGGALNYIHATLFGAWFESVDAGTVTLGFINWLPFPVYLANDNMQQVPGLRILGYGLRQQEGYVTVRDDRSVAIRGERSLDAEMNWIHNRSVAYDVASLMVNMMANPRPQLEMRVVGDPRRRPGDLIAVQDAEGTQADGTWRVLSVGHNLNGPQFTQDLSLVEQLPPARWGYPEGWGTGVWSDI